MEATPEVETPTPVLLWTNSMSKNATPSDNSDGHDESTDHEQRTDGGGETPDRRAAYEFLSRLMAPEGPLATGDDETAADLIRGAADAFGLDVTGLGEATEQVEEPFYELREGIETGSREQVAEALEALEDVYDVGGSQKDWEKIARRRIATRLESFLDEEVTTHAHRVAHAIEEGDDPTDEFWTMVYRFNEFVEFARGDIVTTGGFSHSDTRVRMHSAARHVEETFLRLGKAIEEDTVGEGFYGGDFEHARESLDQAAALLDELEEEHEADENGGEN